eukprot:9216410-Alexandrium_andersonii.AAC.1
MEGTDLLLSTLLDRRQGQHQAAAPLGEGVHHARLDHPFRLRAKKTTHQKVLCQVGLLRGGVCVLAVGGRPCL